VAGATDRKGLPGQEIDGFLLGERLHSGTLSAIYRVTPAATRAQAQAPLIMKLPHTGVGEGGQGLLGFETEATVLPMLSGPHVPRFIAAGDLAKTPYIVFEWVDGETLAAAMERGPLPAADIARIGAAVADALYALHRQEAIHLDLKPENVILRPSGEAVLIDFGTAHHARVPDLLAEEKRFASGSAPYVSPEQVGGSRSELRSDLFALGVILYEMATGELPFGIPASMAGMRDRLWLEPPPPRLFAPDLPLWLQEIILRCLEPGALRYESAAHIAFDLRNPEQVPLTARAARTKRAGLLRQLRRWWQARPEQLPPAMSKAVRVANAPLILVAVDTMHPDDPRHPAIHATVRRILSLRSDFRLICVSVVRGEPVGARGREVGIYLEHLVRLRHWVEPLGLAEGHRLSLHVIESLSPSATLLEFARHNNVDLIVIGAPSPAQQALGWWRSVASGVTANAHCSVHVVRIPEAG